MTIFYTSDTHFGHENIIKYCNRPWRDVREMDRRMETMWNSIVEPDDVVYHLGDFCMGNRQNGHEILKRLNGRKILIAGNHDTFQVEEWPEWEKVFPYLDMKDGNKWITLFHYPIEEWNGKSHRRLHFHGHSHGTSRPMKRRFDVGWDVFNRPMTLAEILDQAKGQGS